MGVVLQRETIAAGNGLRFFIAHFARGSYPLDGRRALTLVFNRMLFFEASDNDAEISDGASRHSLRAGDFLLIPAHRPATLKLGENTRFLSIQFNVDFFGGRDLLAALPRPHLGREPELFTLARDAAEAADTTVGALLLHELLVRAVLRLLPECPTAPPPAERLRRYRALRPMLSGTRDGRPPTVEEMAAAMDMERSAFSRAFRRDFGESPKRYLTRQLLQQAVYLLLRGRHSVGETAKRLGFGSAFYFSRFFKRHTGYSPRRYRELFGAAADGRRTDG